MLQEQKRRWILIYFVLFCAFLAFRIHLIHYYTKNDNENNIVSHIKTLASYKYRDRRMLIQEQCQKKEVDILNLLKVNSDPKWKTSLFFDYDHHLIYCGISKVSSTTWTTNLMK